MVPSDQNIKLVALDEREFSRQIDDRIEHADCAVAVKFLAAGRLEGHPNRRAFESREFRVDTANADVVLSVELEVRQLVVVQVVVFLLGGEHVLLVVVGAVVEDVVEARLV